MKKIMLLGLAVLLVCAVAFSGCLSNDKDTDVIIGYQPSTHQMAYTSAKALDWWAENLTQIEGIGKVSDKSFPSGPSEATALASNAIQAAYIGAAPLIPSIAQGNDLKIVAAVQINGSGLIVPTNADYTDPTYFEGKKIATFPPGSIQDTLLKQWLADNGVDMTKVDIKGMDSGEAQTALKAGSVDAVFLPHPAPSIIVQAGDGKVVMDSGEMSPDHACCVLAVSQKFIDEHPDVVAELVKVHADATKYTNENPEEAAKYYANITGVSESIILQSISDWDGAWISDPYVIEDYVVAYAKSQYDQGLVSKQLTSEDLFDMSFYDAYVKAN
ncbi:putative aliphatic sulfonates-binding protein [Methanimicrococcus sp. At1]|uniref:Aliphatic sulfonates-binding protein n=1 Tax=Methanimicrococcus hacksteinii TaxID=3028293 RepID=A0ABU3VNW7_9EURY|nr:ABC transporter substrate-binding protein [Methanimicrococcus sp. At1]MDV0445096.1 putative aliphatic sulfonates-binding protein [Methanimicrococcus sp. At1]